MAEKTVERLRKPEDGAGRTGVLSCRDESPYRVGPLGLPRVEAKSFTDGTPFGDAVKRDETQSR